MERGRWLPKAANLDGEENGVRLTESALGQWVLSLRPSKTLHQAAEGELLRFPERGSSRRVQVWEELPVAGISVDDAEAYLAWLRKSGRMPSARLCTEHEWERAARGADDRTYPMGDKLATEDANFDLTYGRSEQEFGPDEIGRHPASRSPFGVDDLSGNVAEWTRNVVNPAEPKLRGGSWYQDRAMAYVNNRQPATRQMKNLLIGLRVCASIP